MANLLEMRNLAILGEASDLRRRILAAITMKAVEIIEAAAPTARQIAWARSALEMPERYEQVILHAAIASNAKNSASQIAAADDSAVRDVVDKIVDRLLTVDA